MSTIALAFVIFIRIVGRVVILDILLSWVSLVWIIIKIKFIEDILRPLYDFVRNNIPSTFWAFDFAPIIIILSLAFIEMGVYVVFPEIESWTILDFFVF